MNKLKFLTVVMALAAAPAFGHEPGTDARSKSEDGVSAADEQQMRVAVVSLDDVPPQRPVLSSWSTEVGSAHTADTYLTPLHYRGWHTGLHYERMQAMKFDPDRWIMQLDIRLDLDRTLNVPARNTSMWSADLSGRWTMMRRKDFFIGGKKVTAAVGPGVTLRGGVLYLSHNGNNPASAKGTFTADLRAMAAYSLRLGRLPVTLRYEGALPVTGAFFAPDYGQLYYEIWLGERKGLCHGAWWGNYFSLDNLVTAALRFGGTTLRLGYHNFILSTKASHIVSRRITHAFTIGITTEWLSLNSRRRPSPYARKISALY